MNALKHTITIILTSVLLLLFFPLNAQRPFTIVIDAGHGGRDAGAIGKYSKEKDLNLAVSLLLGEKIKENYPDVKVVYTRKTDIFIPLQGRADIVNENHADIFFCIHTNAIKSSATTGTETYVLGLHKSQSNLDVAMRENSVITLEDDYKSKYEGFDPSSTESYIMFEYMQDKYIDNSVQLATFIESQFKKADRYSRGVRQAGFLVLHKSACPSVLIEMGFISNRSEENFLNSAEGKETITNAIFRAFELYKQGHDKKSGVKGSNNIEKRNVQNDSDKQIEQANNINEKVLNKENTKDVINDKRTKSEIVYKIQILVSKSKLRSKDSDFKGLKNYSYFREDGMYKYTYGEETDFSSIEKLRKSISKKFPKAYVIAFDGKKKIAVEEARKRQ